MKKIIYLSLVVLITIISIFLLWTYFYLYTYDNNPVKQVDKSSTWSTNVSLDKNKENKEYIKSKLDIIKNRLKVKDIISKWDSYFQNEQLSLAVIQYKIALNKNPDDYKMIEKIWDIYFEMKNFEEAKNYYLKLLNNKYILSLIYSKDVTKKINYDSIKQEIEKNISDKDKVFFYTNSLFCLEDFHLCKKNFDEKIIMDKDNLKLPELIEIKNALKTYTDFWLVNIYYKNTLVIWSFMKLKLYPLSIKLWKDLIVDKPDYKAILQIIAQSYFDIWDYKNSYIYLKNYFEINPTDSNAAYILWITNLKLSDYILSNIFLNKALYLWYNDTLNVRRKISFNYYMLNEFDKMYKVFDEMINSEKNISTDDINIMINHSIETNKNEKTYEWTKKWLKLFPKEPLFYAYMWKLELDLWNIVTSTVYLKRWLELDINNQLLNYISWLLKIKENNIEEAKIFLEKAYNVNKNNSLSKEIKIELDKL